MGMPKIEFRLQMFRGDWDQIWSQLRLLWAMEGLCRINGTHIRQFDEFKKRGMVENTYPPLYRAGLHYETEKGTEIWPDLPSLYAGTMGEGVYSGPWGDCLPISTLVLRDDYALVPIGFIQPGDRIMEEGRFVTVLRHGITGKKPILSFQLGNQLSFSGSPEHRLFTPLDKEIRVETVREGTFLRTAVEVFPETVAMTKSRARSLLEVFPPESIYARVLHHLFGHRIVKGDVAGGTRVLSIVEKPPELCADITTDTGRFYLPESDLIVHNCEDFACVRVAEYRELPWHYEKTLKTNDGKTRLVKADPRFPQGDWESAIAAELPSSATAVKDPSDQANWPGWKKVMGGVEAKPFAKWRRGPHGNYHYHALVLMPDGRLEDPSLVLGMGRERQFHDDGMAEKMKSPDFPVRLQYAAAPLVMVVDPEKPSGYAGGAAVQLDARVKQMVEDGMAPEDIAATLGDAEIGAYLGNTIPLGEGEFDVDAVIGWNRAEGRFEPKTDQHEYNRLAGYVNH